MIHSPIISVGEARKYLGKGYEKLSDEEIENLVRQTHEFAKLALEAARQQRLHVVDGTSPTRNASIYPK